MCLKRRAGNSELAKASVLQLLICIAAAALKFACVECSAAVHLMCTK